MKAFILFLLCLGKLQFFMREYFETEMEKMNILKLNQEGMVEIGINPEGIEAEENKNPETMNCGTKGTDKNHFQGIIVPSCEQISFRIDFFNL